MFEIGGRQIPATLAELVDPKRTALLLWDMENAIAPNAFNYQDILANLKMLAALARAVNVPVFIRFKLRSTCSMKKPTFGCACA